MKVSEIFGPVVQGEGALIGQPTFFIRFGGCDFRCAWCDTMYAVDPAHRDEWESMTPETIVNRLRLLTKATGYKPWVTLSGGNPLIQPASQMEHLVTALRQSGYRVAVETQGSIWQPWLELVDHVTLSPKPPSSGMVDKLLPAVLHRFLTSRPAPTVKIVIADNKDFKWAVDLVTNDTTGRVIHDRHLDVVFQVCNTMVAPYDGDEALALHRGQMLDDLRRLQEAVTNLGLWHVTVLPQLHTLIYGNKRGV